MTIYHKKGSEYWSLSADLSTESRSQAHLVGVRPQRDAERPRQAKVGDLEVPGLVDQEVLRLEVAVKDSSVRGVGEGRARRGSKVGRLRTGRAGAGSGREKLVSGLTSQKEGGDRERTASGDAQVRGAVARAVSVAKSGVSDARLRGLAAGAGETHSDEIAGKASSGPALALGARDACAKVHRHPAVGRGRCVHVLLQVEVEKFEDEAEHRVRVNNVE